MRTYPLRAAAIMFAIAALAALGLAARPTGVTMAAAATPQPSPTNPPTPFMPLQQIPNGSWDVIEQTRIGIDYSRMTLKEIGDTVSGTWFVDKKTAYALEGTRQGAHLTLQIKSTDKPDTVIGKIEADIDGIADMIGTITLGPLEIAFQGAQHGRVPAPIDNTNTPAPMQSPF